MTIKIYKDQNAGAVFIENSNGVQFLNSLQATMDDPADVKINITDLSKSVQIFTQVPFADFVDQSGSAYGSTATETCNALNAEFSASGSSTGIPPEITSATTITMINIPNTVTNNSTLRLLSCFYIVLKPNHITTQIT